MCWSTRYSYIYTGAENEGPRSSKVQGKGAFNNLIVNTIYPPVPAGGAGCTHGHAELLPLELPLLSLGGLTEAAARPGHRADTRPGL